MNEKNLGSLYLIPSPLSENGRWSTSTEVMATLLRVSALIVERAKTTRSWLHSLGLSPRDFTLYELPENLDSEEINTLLAPLLAGHSLGVVSEAGCPGIADPGEALCHAAHTMGACVIPLVGPSSILLALMASGLNGQRFEFHGYLPIEVGALRATLLKAQSSAHQKTHLFIETPYRNQKTFSFCLSVLSADIKFCVAENITSVDEKIQTKTIAEWRRLAPTLSKSPTLFLFGAAPEISQGEKTVKNKVKNRRSR